VATCGHRYQDCKAFLGISSDLPPKAAIIVVFTGYSIRPQRGNARSERRTTARRKEVERRTKPGPSASGVWCLGRLSLPWAGIVHSVMLYLQEQYRGRSTYLSLSLVVI